MLFEQQANDELRRVDEVAQVGEISGRDEHLLVEAHPEQDEVRDMHDHRDSAAEILPEELVREGELPEHFQLEETAGDEDQHQHGGFEDDEGGDPGKIGDPDALRIKVGHGQTGKEDEELDRRENRLRSRPLGRISFFKLFRCITRHGRSVQFGG